MTKPLLALLAAGSLAAAATACGSSTTSGTSSSASVASASTSTATPPAATTTARSTPAPSTPKAKPSTATSTSSSPASTHTGGDESIQKFGAPAGGGDTAAVTTAVKDYYAAVAADDGTKACELLDKGLQKSVMRAFGRAPSLRNKNCAGILSLFFKHRPGQGAPLSGAVEVSAVRVRGDRGFALISTKTTPSGEISVAREGGAWKVAALIGGPLG